MDVNQNTLLPLEQRPSELGRIRMGDPPAEGKNHPTTRTTWRLTSPSAAYLDAAAAIYGGIRESWDDAPDEGYYQLETESRELRVLIPRDLRTLTQAYEWWQGGTCERRCDGTFEQISGKPCLCDPADRECAPRTRLSIMLPDVPGLGIWRLETSGYHAATSLPATIELLKNLSEKPWIPAVLRLEQRSKKTRENGKVVTHRFAVPVLDLPGITVGKIVARMANAETPQIEAAAPAAPPTARERAAQQAAAIEAVTTSGASAPQDAEADATTTADEPPHPAGARADTPRRVGSTDPGTPSGEPMPAAAAEVAGVPLPATSDRCEGFDGEKGACVRDPGHTGNHTNRDRETWK